MRGLNALLAALDISEQIDRGLVLVRSIANPVTCLILAGVLAAINALLCVTLSIFWQ